MGLDLLTIEHVRCLSGISLSPISAFNLFVGENGSGKTSVLEAIHILGLGRSFRNLKIDTVIQYGQDFLSVTAKSKNRHLGIQKTKENKTTIRIDGESFNTPAKLAKILPIQLIHPDSDELITGSPTMRRQFMDWGVFHVEHSYLAVWKKGHYLLKQRNAALKARASREELSAWDEQYAPICQEISQARSSYIQRLLPYFKEVMAGFSRLPPVSLSYQYGWDSQDLKSLLAENYTKDLHSGHTHLGFHRDELEILAHQQPSSSILSRGEQKSVMIALKLAQVKLLYDLTQKSCLFLIDDFSAELDAQHQFQLVQNLSLLNSQVFLSCINFEEVKSAFNSVNLAVFHVEQGRINRV